MGGHFTGEIAEVRADFAAAAGRPLPQIPRNPRYGTVMVFPDGAA